jgi:Tfp pilus assembly protein PilN
MRPVNLIPPDERQGDAAPLRTGSLIYVLVAGLSLLLLGIVVVALTSKQISDRESQKADLQGELAQVTARANTLAAFTDFRAVQQSRADTVTSLANSRFDWQRVLHELSLVLPDKITLISMVGTASPDVQVQDAEQVTLRTTAAGPALEITGCTSGQRGREAQDTVATFVASLEDIDGVTRVGLDSSKIEDPALSGGDSGGADTESDSGGCGPRDAKFQVVVAFDEVPTPPTATAAPSVPPSAAPSTSGGQAQVASTQTPGS